MKIENGRRAQNSERTGSNEIELILPLRPPRVAFSQDVMLNDSHSISLSVEKYLIGHQISILLVVAQDHSQHEASVFEPQKLTNWNQKWSFKLSNDL